MISAPVWPRWASPPRASTPSRSALLRDRRRASRRHRHERPTHPPPGPFGPARGPPRGTGATPARAPPAPAGEPGDGPTIEFARSSLAIPWSGEYASLLELAEACDVPVRWSCRTGVCHNCETTLIAGDVEYSPDPVQPPADGSVLICCSRPSDDVVLDL